MKTLDYYINHQNLAGIFLELIKPKYGNEFKVKFQESAQTMQSDIESASMDSTCSCTSRIRNFINLKKEEWANFLFNYTQETNRETIVETIATEMEKQFMNSTAGIDYRGKVAKTTIEEWPTFYKAVQTEKGIYRSFSVVKEGQDVYVFFL